MKAPLITKVINKIKAIEKYRIIEVIENENGIAIKYANGMMDVYARKQYTGETTKKYNDISWFLYDTNPPKYPIPFVELPFVEITALANGGTFCYACFVNENRLDRFPNTCFGRTASITNPIEAQLHAFGKWK